MLAMVLLGQLGRNAMSMSSHAGDGAAESCWRFGWATMLTLNPTGDDAAKSTLTMAGCHCDRTTSKMRGLSPKIISGDSQQSKNAQT
jgi:hypothetical protein